MCAGLTDSQLHGEGKRIYQSIQYDSLLPHSPCLPPAAVALYAPCRSNSRALTWQFAQRLIFIFAASALEESVPEDGWRVEKKNNTDSTSCLCRCGSAASDLPQGDWRRASSVHQQSNGKCFRASQQSAPVRFNNN